MGFNKDDEVGGLWERHKDGRVFMTGSINGQDVVLFHNDFKKDGERTPDWRVYRSQPRAGGERGAPVCRGSVREERVSAPEPVYAPPLVEDDIPF